MVGTVKRSVILLKLAVAALAAAVLATGLISAQQEDLAEQRMQYEDDSPKTILELQPLRQVTRVGIRRADGMEGVATLVNLSPQSASWYLLTLDWLGRAPRVTFHLQTARSTGSELRLLAADRGRELDIEIGSVASCKVWSAQSGDALASASESRLPYAPICSGELYVRNPVKGHQTSLERVTDFLRDRVWGGDQVIEFVKRELYRDRFIERSNPVTAATPDAPGSITSGPVAAQIAPESATQALETDHLGIDVDAEVHNLMPGKWYGVHDLQGVAVSAVAPKYLPRSLLLGREPSVNPLGEAESEALVYLVSFDLNSLDLHFVMGTDHPRLDWSERPPALSQDPRLPGPDGIDTAAPLVTNGMVNPSDARRTVAAFVGGFKRTHGAFKRGPLALQNHGSHYGFIEQGVIFSKLQPGLATVFATDSGLVDLKTWTLADNARLENMRYARQNGVPLIELDPQRGVGVPGNEVNLWGPGNWSGSANEDLRTLRAGLCLQQTGRRRHLIYGYFSSATPSAMARVFQAYGCRYAMHLDMNALEHTYLALYVRSGKQLLVEHLIDGMQAVDRSSHGELLPRFLAFPDDRDFFYLTQREHP
jgi:hypothetical protein